MNVGAMRLADKLEQVFRKAGGILPGDAGRRLLALVSPQALAIMAAVVALWAASHFVGVGEIADVVLLAAGWLTIGGAAISGGRKLVSFATTIYRARTEADLDRAARDLADAISILGVDVVLGLLLKGKPEGTFKTVWKPNVQFPSYQTFAKAMPRGGPTRMYEAEITFTRGNYAGQGFTNPKAVTRIGRDPGARTTAEAFREIEKAVYHERVHQRLTQAFSLLGRPALYLKLGAYKRSFILRYVEEAAAETYALAKVKGARGDEIAGYRFPLNGNYQVTLGQLADEAKGILLGPVVVGASTYNVYHGLDHERR